MFRSPLQINRQRRVTAWLLVLVCAWMGSGGVLHHTEADFAGHTVPKAASSLHCQTAAMPVDTCAACQWTQGLQGRLLSVCRIQSPLFYPHPRRHSAAALLIARTPHHRPSRAPPVSSFC